MNDLDAIAADELRGIEADGLCRTLSVRPGTNRHGQANTLNFASNDYLNLANDPKLIEAAQAAVGTWGCGATGSRLLSGNLPIHEELEHALAALLGTEAALVFPSGYQANIGLLTSLADPDDVIFSDELNHASIIDGARLSKATIKVYSHANPVHLESMLENASGFRRRLIVSDALFSMDGDLAPVRKLDRLAKRYKAMLIVDEAHAVGVFGNGGGVCRAEGVAPDARVVTLSKALGSGGGAVCCSAALRDLLVNKARSFIFSTGLSPACAGSALAALQVVRESPELGTTLLRRASDFAKRLSEQRLPVVNSASQVIPITVGSNNAVVRWAEVLKKSGLFAAAIRPPSVPKGTARLRLSVTLAHLPEDLDRAAGILAESAVEAGV